MPKHAIWTSNNIWAEEDKSIHPKQAVNFLPDWLKNTPPQIDNGVKSKYLPKIRTVKKCPSFTDIYKDGYILVAPFDIWLSVKKQNDTVVSEWRTPHEELVLDIHKVEQMVDHLPKESNVKQIFKLIYPFKCITPKGYSIRQLPLYYHYNNDWHVPYGVINTDKHHEINLQICYTSINDEVLIKKGTPMAHIVTFKRSDRIKMKYKKFNKKLHAKTLSSNFFIFRHFQNGYYQHDFNK